MASQYFPYPFPPQPNTKHRKEKRRNTNMCNNENNTRSRCRRRESKSDSSVSVKPSRKTRSKTRKPKYLSLLHLEENLPQMTLHNSNAKNSHRQQQQQLNLFPLHPGNFVEDKDTQYDNVCLLFNATGEDDVHAVTLNGILDDESSDYKNETTTTTTTTSEESPLSPSLTYGYRGEDHTRSLLRSAIKGKKERDESEEKWVVYSEVVEKKEMEEVSSCGGGHGGGDGGARCSSTSNSSSKKKMKKLLALKLDYEEIMNAWSDKGPLYIEGESPQTVPGFHDAAVAPHVVGDPWGNVSNVLRVPEMVSNNVDAVTIKEEFDGKEDWRRRHRVASVLRYKEKRQNRLFSKRIRYEVRKLNAEKRPRLKGRFIKRD